MGKKSRGTKGTVRHFENLNEAKDFDKISTRKRVQRQFNIKQ